MEFFQLPHLDGRNSLGQALRAMQDHDRRGVVVELSPASHVLFRNRDVLTGIARREADAALSVLPGLGIEGADVASLGPLTEEVERALDRAGHMRSLRRGEMRGYQGNDLELQDALQRTMSEAGAHYYLVAATDRGALLVSASERYAAEIDASEVVCVCDRNEKHTGTAPPEGQGDQCPHCEGHFNCA